MGAGRRGLDKRSLQRRGHGLRGLRHCAFGIGRATLVTPAVFPSDGSVWCFCIDVHCISIGLRHDFGAPVCFPDALRGGHWEVILIQARRMARMVFLSTSRLDSFALLLTLVRVVQTEARSLAADLGLHLIEVEAILYYADQLKLLDLRRKRKLLRVVEFIWSVPVLMQRFGSVLVAGFLEITQDEVVYMVGPQSAVSHGCEMVVEEEVVMLVVVVGVVGVIGVVVVGEGPTCSRQKTWLPGQEIGDCDAAIKGQRGKTGTDARCADARRATCRCESWFSRRCFVVQLQQPDRDMCSRDIRVDLPCILASIHRFTKDSQLAQDKGGPQRSKGAGAQGRNPGKQRLPRPGSWK